MDRLGFGYDELRAIKSDIIYAHSNSFGTTGPYVNSPLFATLVQAITGWTHTSWRRPEARGAKSLGIGDESAGVSLALGILGALVNRERTGQGDRVEVVMQEAQRVEEICVVLVCPELRRIEEIPGLQAQCRKPPLTSSAAPSSANLGVAKGSTRMRSAATP